MKKCIVLIFGLLLNYLTFGQTGYYGALNSLELKYGAGLSLRSKYKLKVKDNDTTLTKSPQYVNPSFGINYNRVINNKFSIILGYNYAKIGILAKDLNSPTGRQLIETYKAPYHGLAFEFRWFRRGNINPVGKYMGFAIELGQSKFDLNDYNYFDNQTLIASGLLKSEYIVTDRQDNINPIVISPVRNFFIKGIIGRNFQINKQMFYSVNATYNFLGVSTFQGLREVSFFPLESNRNRDLDDDDDFRSLINNFNTVASSIFSSKRMVINLGVHYTF